MVLTLSIASTVRAVTVDNIMTELQMEHAVWMASVPSDFDDIGIGSNVMALHPNGQMWPGSICKTEEFTDGTVIFTVMFLDSTASRVGLQNIHHRDNTVSYDNFGRTALRCVHVNSANVSRAIQSGNGGSAAAGGSRTAMHSGNGRSAAAGGPRAILRERDAALNAVHASDTAASPTQARSMNWEQQAREFQRRMQHHAPRTRCSS